MGTYHVKYSYLATGMEGMADEKDCGLINAENPDDARNIAAIKEYPVDVMYGPNNSYSSRDFFRAFLEVKEFH